MMRKFFSIQFVFILSLFILPVFFLTNSSVRAETIVLTKEDGGVLENDIKYDELELFDLMSPSYVKILQHVEGSVSIPSFIIDSENKTIAIDNVKEPTILENVNENFLGSGFFVSPDGYIATNAHTASLYASKLVIIDAFIQEAISEATGGKDVEETIDKIFNEEIVDFIIQNTDFDLNMNLIVLSPGANLKDEEFNLYDLGFNADVVFTNDDFYKNGYDVSILKINADNYPSASFSEKDNIDLGSKVYLFKTQSESPLTDVHELIDEKSNNVLLSSVVVREKTFASSSIYELDLPASASFAGSMVFDESGKILGIASYDASYGFKDQAHTFIIPKDYIENIFSNSSSSPATFESTFYKRVKEGFIFERELRCEDAYASFAVAAGVENPFIDKNVFNKRVELCNEKLAESQKQDDNFSVVMNSFQNKISSMTILNWMVVVAIFITLFFIVLFFVSKKVQKKNKGYTGETPIQDETIKTARRAPLSEMSNNKEKEINADIIPPQKDSVQNINRVDNKKEDVDVETKASNTVSQKQEDSGEIFHTTTASFARRTNLHKKVDETKTESKGISNDISEDDKERLASLWPNKYSKENTKRKEMVAYPAVSSYIKHARKDGFEDIEIKKELLRVGWKEEDIDNAFKATV